ncbi:glycerophosphodiester phosphodiesterase family protein [Paraflavitalea pollutisoli]|uniref:glycerophosphodiester phosphodiesterase family protein n=1 Tax=Paraflavitalea pollutisoli TaxID=3034143 RepID=UPI0023EBA3C7|nr:glycerophosphodiester phosphodiesterase family protein [Paraflavitalea sp. H1-2-19X]
MKRQLSTWLLLLACSLGAGAQQSANYLSFRNVAELQRFLSYSPSRVPLVSAHRGGPAKGFPENAVETFSNSLNDQPLIVECDIALSKDSVLMMMHDNTLDRTTTGKGKVEDYTWEELKQLYLKDNEGNLTAFRIPSLDEVLNWGRGKVIYTLDVKRGVPFARVIDAVRRAKAEAGNVIITYNADQADEVHKLAPDLLLSVTIRNAQELQRLHDKGIPDEKMVAFVGVSQPDSSLYNLLHGRKIQCILGTMGNLDRQATARGDKMYAEYISNGADILSTDRPKEAGAVLKQYREDNKLKLPNGPSAGRARP